MQAVGLLKPWYRCIVAEQSKLMDLYHKYSSGQLDRSEPVSARLDWSRALSDAVRPTISSEYLLMYRLEKMSLQLATMSISIFQFNLFCSILYNSNLNSPASSNILNQEDENLTIYFMWP